MSNNQGPHGASGGTLPFIVAQFNDHKVAISRNSDYAETLISVQAAFEGLQSVSSKRIMLCAKFPEFEGEIQIKEDLWGELLPSLTQVVVRVPKTGEVASTDGSSTNNPVSTRNAEPGSSVTSATSMQIFCKTLRGKTIILRVEPSDSVVSMKRKIQQQLQVAPEQQRLIFSGKVLEDRRKLSYYNVCPDAVVHLIFRLSGST
ncbi:hypothetical protein FRC06_006493 [Ceratobasidium sp. 370]|nr:hypothetical protein FRC06_006493 [Ceratobasidium sp. 370]